MWVNVDADLNPLKNVDADLNPLKQLQKKITGKKLEGLELLPTVLKSGKSFTFVNRFL